MIVKCDPNSVGGESYTHAHLVVRVRDAGSMFAIKAKLQKGAV